MTGIELSPVIGMPEVHPGDDLATLIAAFADVRTGDVLVVTQKVVSKAENRLVAVDPDDPLVPQGPRRRGVGAGPAPPG